MGLFLAVAASILVYVVAVSFILPALTEDSALYTRQMINRLRAQSAVGQGVALPPDPEMQGVPVNNPLVKGFLMLPGMQRGIPLIQRAGLWKKLDKLALASVILFLALSVALSGAGIAGVPLAYVAAWVLVWMYLKRRVKKYRRQFIDTFPDALDSIVRSVRAGYPLNSAIAVVGDSMEAPVGPEFKRVADETAYGWTLFEALSRLAERIDEPDVKFFTIVLNIQQESGGSLSEVLSNLSNVLRKRKQMRLKINALSSEGRATAWVLGSLPFFVFGVIYFAAPQHLQPLFTTDAGHLIIFVVLGMIFTGVMIVRQIINMEI